jgi:multiple RNA-binding domain-containing protein 1
LFGFIGFSSAAEADSAVTYFNKTFLDASRLEVEFAFQYGAQEQPRAWSKYTEGSSAHQRLVEATGANTVALGKGKEGEEKGKKKKKTKEPKPEEVDPKLKEFMALMQPRAKQAVWANDDLGAADGAVTTAAALGSAPGGGAGKGKVVMEDGDGSDDELYDDLPAAEASSSEDDSDDAGENEKNVDAVVVDTGVSDLDYLKSRVRKNFDEDDDVMDDAQIEEEESEDDDEEESGSSDDDEEEESEEEEDTKEAKKQTDGEDLDDIFSGKKKRETEANGAAVNGQDKNGAGGAGGNRSTRSDDPSTFIAETGRLFVRNLPYSATEDDLKGIFEPYGSLEEVHIVIDKATRRSKGYALVQFSVPGEAVAAFHALDRSIFMGRLLHVLPGMKAPTGVAEEQTGAGGQDAGDAGADADGGENTDNSNKAALKGNTSSYKRQKEADLKASAGNTVAWNSLFMRADTVAEAVAAHYGVTKSDLLDPNAPDMAVRMALGETQVIAETKSALAEAGVDVEALVNAAAAAGGGGKGDKKAKEKSSVVRSDCILLVKNLPYSADEEELETMFAAIGPVLRIVLPPTRTLALVEYSEAQDARRAFKALAYKRYQAVPIYLEWAPKGIFNSKKSEKKKDTSAAVAKEAAAGVEKAKKKKEVATEDEQATAVKAGSVRAEDVAASLAAGATGDESIESTTIYVKNLSFNTEEPALNTHFSDAVEAAGGALRAAKVAKSKTKDGRVLNSGFGFIECSSEAVAREVIKALQGSNLDGHSLVLQLSSKNEGGGAGGGSAADAGKRKKNGSNTAAVPPNKGAIKIVVRNLAFEASRKDILGLFTPFGAVKSCRLPRKFDGSLRGFAFVEFATPQEARAAVEAVSGTHLYGRRLVIEWAEDEGGLEELRVKTANGFRGGEMQSGNGGGGGFGGGGSGFGGGAEEEFYDEEQANENTKKRRKK